VGRPIGPLRASRCIGRTHLEAPQAECCTNLEARWYGSRSTIRTHLEASPSSSSPILPAVTRRRRGGRFAAGSAPDRSRKTLEAGRLFRNGPLARGGDQWSQPGRWRFTAAVFRRGSSRRRNARWKGLEVAGALGAQRLPFGGYLRGPGTQERARELPVLFCEITVAPEFCEKVQREREGLWGVAGGLWWFQSSSPAPGGPEQASGGVLARSGLSVPVCVSLVAVGVGRSCRGWWCSGEVAARGL
jgi:hypothetical protein